MSLAALGISAKTTPSSRFNLAVITSCWYMCCSDKSCEELILSDLDSRENHWKISPKACMATVDVFTFDVRVKTFLAAELGGWFIFHAIWVCAHQTRPRWPIPPCKIWRAIGRARVGVQKVICHRNTFFCLRGCSTFKQCCCRCRWSSPGRCPSRGIGHLITIS